MSEPRTIVTVDGLTVGFDGHDVTHGVSLTLVAGRITALVGESGSGKSVTAMALPRLDPSLAAVRGRAILHDGDAGDARDIDLLAADAPLRRMRGELIGTVFQEPTTAFNPVFTLGAQVAESLRCHQPSLTRAERRRRVLDQLREVGLDDAERVYASYPHELSGGQLQRVMIAMAIINRPRVLIADEPTTALDVTTQQAILALLTSLAADLRIAVLLITHDMGVVWQAAQDVAVMRGGRIIERGSVAEAFRHPVHEYTKRLLAAVPRLHVDEPGASTGAGVGDGASSGGRIAAQLEDVGVTYRGGRHAVRHISLDLTAGRTRALVGESGAGKTTIAKVISGQLAPSEGSVLIDGEDLARAHGRRRRGMLARMGYVFQDSGSALNPRRSVAWSIAEPMVVHGGFGAHERRARVLELLDQVELPRDVADRYPHQLSGGQRQRVGIARALALNPSLLIADEPTSSLDVTVQRTVLDLLRRLQREHGFACLFITHDLGIVQEVADEVSVLRGGRLVEAGPTARVLGSPQHDYTRTLLAASPRIDLGQS